MKTIPGIEKKYSEKILALFNELPKGSSAVLFGSRAKDTFREGSDIDFALKGEGITANHRDQLLLKYDNLDFPWKLDLVIYSSITEPALKEHIDRVGIRLF